MKINFRELMADQMNGNSEAVDFCIKFAEEHQAKGDISDEELLKDLLKHVAEDSNKQKTKKVVELNTKVAESIQHLTFMGCWPQLAGISRHALQAEIEALEREEQVPFRSMIIGNKIRLAVLTMGSVDFEKTFQKEFLAKFDI